MFCTWIHIFVGCNWLANFARFYQTFNYLKWIVTEFLWEIWNVSPWEHFYELSVISDSTFRMNVFSTALYASALYSHKVCEIHHYCIHRPFIYSFQRKITNERSLLLWQRQTHISLKWVSIKIMCSLFARWILFSLHQNCLFTNMLSVIQRIEMKAQNFLFEKFLEYFPHQVCFRNHQ